MASGKVWPALKDLHLPSLVFRFPRNSILVLTFLRFGKQELGRMIYDFASISGAKDISRAGICVRLRSWQELVLSLFLSELAFDDVLSFALRYAIRLGSMNELL